MNAACAGQRLAAQAHAHAISIVPWIRINR
jgi:hypothetical protein